MLVGRQSEISLLRRLRHAADRSRPQLAVLFGRRRVGKTYLCLTLLDELRSHGDRVVYFNATEESETIQLDRLARALVRDLGAEAQQVLVGQIASWEHALELLVLLAQEQRLTVVIDEVSFLTRSTDGFASVIQAVWDRAVSLGKTNHLLLVLTGSAVGTLVGLISAGGPLFRRGEQVRLEPLGIRDAAQILQDADPEGIVEAYAACGGTPLYLQAWDAKAPTAENLHRLAGTPGGLLLEDAPTILRDEIGAEIGFARVLAAIGTGLTRRSTISNAAAQRIETSLEVLQRAGLVRRAVPLGAPRRAQPLYDVPEPYLRFWYSVLYRNRELIEGGQGRQVLKREEPAIRSHFSWAWEELARQHAVDQVGYGLPPDCLIGRWWDRNGQDEIDVLGLDGSRTSLVGEAKWTNKPVDMHDVGRLLDKATRTPGWRGTPTVAVWSRSGATDSVIEAGVVCFGPRDVVSDTGTGPRPPEPQG